MSRSLVACVTFGPHRTHKLHNRAKPELVQCANLVEQTFSVPNDPPVCVCVSVCVSIWRESELSERFNDILVAYNTQRNARFHSNAFIRLRASH